MAIFKIVGIAIIAVTLVMVIRSYKPEMAIQVSIAAGNSVYNPACGADMYGCG